MATDYTAYFRGKVVQEHYQQSVAVIQGEGRYVGTYETQSFTFEGLTESQANYDGEITCTDVAGTIYTFNLRESFTDASTGSAVFATEECRVQRTRVSPHLWTVTFTRTGAKLYQNGVLKFNGPTWMDHYNT